MEGTEEREPEHNCPGTSPQYQPINLRNGREKRVLLAPHCMSETMRLRETAASDRDGGVLHQLATVGPRPSTAMEL